MIYALEKLDEVAASATLQEATARRQASQLSILRRKYVTLVEALAARQPKKVVRCAANLIDLFAHWQKWKLANHRTPWVYLPLKFIYQDLMEVYSIHVIRSAIALLENLNLLEKRHNPGNYQDKTYQYNLLFDSIQALLNKLGIAEDGIAKTPTPSPFVSPESSSVNPESPSVSPESPRFTRESDTQLQSTNSGTNILATANSAAVEKEFVDTEAQPYQSNFVNPADVKLNVSDLVEEEEEQSIQKQPNPGKDKCSPSRDVNQVEIASGENDVISVSNDVLGEVEKLVGEEYSPQLEKLVLTTQIKVVKNAIAFVKEKLALGIGISRKAGYLTNAIKSRLEPSSPVRSPRSSSEEEKYPPGFLEWYEQASEAGWVEKRELRHLSRMNGGDPLVFVPSQRRSMRWYEAQALFDSGGT